MKPVLLDCDPFNSYMVESLFNVIATLYSIPISLFLAIYIYKDANMTLHARLIRLAYNAIHSRI